MLPYLCGFQAYDAKVDGHPCAVSATLLTIAHAPESNTSRKLLRLLGLSQRCVRYATVTSTGQSMCLGLDYTYRRTYVKIPVRIQMMD